MEKYCLAAVAFALMCSLSEGEPCSSSEIEFDQTCPTDCSQKPPRITGDKVNFTCHVGTKKEVDSYRGAHEKEFLPESIIFDAPKMKGVELYWKSFDGPKYELSLKLNFSLPKGISNPIWRLPKAVLLMYESIPGQYEDNYYVNCPREKIFEFKFEPFHSYDMIHPRQLVDDCYVGLDELKEKLVYNITLQTSEGKNASYITTVKARSMNQAIWHPVIMTYLNETDGELYIVIEKPPSTYNVHSYNVSLVLGENKVILSEKILVHATNSTMFANLTRGQYKIKVRPLCKGHCNKTVNVVTESYRIDASMLPRDPSEKDYPQNLEESLKPLKIVAMVIGCLLGAILLLTITYCIRRRPKYQEISSGKRPRGILLHPLERNDNAIVKLKQYISEVCDCTVADCMDLHPDSELKANKSTADRVKKGLKDSTFVLVLYSSDCYNSIATSFESEFYSCFLNEAVTRRQKYNDVRIVPLEFPFNSSSDLPSVISKNSIQPIKCCTENIYCKIHGLDKRSPNRKNLQSENLSDWGDISSELRQKMRQGKKNAIAPQGESDPLLQGTDIPDNNIEGKAKHHVEVVKPVLQDHFKLIAMMNAETDSVIALDRESPKPRHTPFKGSTEDCVNQHMFDNGKSQIKGKPENLDQLNDDTYGKHNQSNVQMCEAEVHYSDENTKSNPLERRRPAVHRNDQPFSLPADLQHPRHHHHHHHHHIPHFNEKNNQTVGHNEFTPALKFNMEESDTDYVLNDDSSDTERGQDGHFTDSHHRRPLMHGHLHHYPVFIPNRELGHRNVMPSRNSSHQSDDFFDQPIAYHRGNAVCNRHNDAHTATYRPDSSHGLTHQQIFNHGIHQYQPDDFISSIHSDHNTSPSFHMHPADFDQGGYPCHHHHHQDSLHSVIHLNETDQNSPAAHDLNLHNFPTDQTPSSSRISFDAIDPPDTDEHGESIHTTDDLLRKNSVQSLPSDLAAVDPERFSPPEDLHYNSPEPPQDLDEGWQSNIMDQLVEINKMST